MALVANQFAYLVFTAEQKNEQNQDLCYTKNYYNKKSDERDMITIKSYLKSYYYTVACVIR